VHSGDPSHQTEMLPNLVVHAKGPDPLAPARAPSRITSTTIQTGGTTVCLFSTPWCSHARGKQKPIWNLPVHHSGEEDRFSMGNGWKVDFNHLLFVYSE